METLLISLWLSIVFHGNYSKVYNENVKIDGVLISSSYQSIKDKFKKPKKEFTYVDPYPEEGYEQIHHLMYDSLKFSFTLNDKSYNLINIECTSGKYSIDIGGLSLKVHDDISKLRAFEESYIEFLKNSSNSKGFIYVLIVDENENYFGIISISIINDKINQINVGIGE